MQDVKNADEPKNEIMDLAEELFTLKGYDNTTISKIIKKVGVARGIIYYHFKSKENIMNALIKRQTSKLLTESELIANDKNIPVLKRMIKTLMSMNTYKDNPVNPITEALHKPQNALMYQKIEETILKKVPPILLEITKDGINKGIFNTASF